MLKFFNVVHFVQFNLFQKSARCCCRYVIKRVFIYLVTYSCRPERSVSERLFLYHQWLAQFGNTVRYGAFTAVTHVLSVFTSLTALLDFTLIAYILLPAGKYEGEFELVPQSFLIGCICPAFGYCCILFLLELLLRNIKSAVKSPGNAYYTVCSENKNLTAQHRKVADNVQYPFMLQEGDFDLPFVWDLSFQTKTTFLSRFLQHANSETASIFFGDQDIDKFVSTCDDKDVSVLSLQIPRYSGVALNHLLGDSSHVSMKGSSLFDLINRDESVISLQSVVPTSSYLSVTDDSYSDAIVVDIESDVAIVHDHYFESDQKSSQISSLCSVDGTTFWRQYKNQKQANKSRQIAAAVDSETGRESDEREKDYLEKVPSNIDKSGREQFTDTQNKSIRQRKHSDKRKIVDDKIGKAAEPVEFLDMVIDLTSVEETNEVHLEMAGVEYDEERIINTLEDVTQGMRRGTFTFTDCLNIAF